MGNLRLCGLLGLRPGLELIDKHDGKQGGDQLNEVYRGLAESPGAALIARVDNTEAGSSLISKFSGLARGAQLRCVLNVCVAISPYPCLLQSAVCR